MKKGFISTSIIYSFIIVFLLIIVSIVGYNFNKVRLLNYIIDKVKNPPTKAATYPIDGLILRLDASTITGLNDGDKITTWTDLSNSNNNAYQNTENLKPTYKTNILNGRSVVRMPSGSYTYLNLTSNINNIRTAFVVYKAIEIRTYAHVFGHLTLYDWHSEGNYVISTTWGNAYLKNGQCWEDGVSKVPTALLKPTVHKLHTFISTANVNVGNISKDRDMADRTFSGEYAEILFYNRVLTEAERLETEEYLGKKWLGW